MKTKIKGETLLEKRVARWINSSAEDYELGPEGVLNDLMYGGCQSGMVGELIYYNDTVRFYKRYQSEIDALLKDALDNTGLSIAGLFGDKWDNDDPLVRDTFNQNLLAWFGFEETARILADRHGIET